MTATAPPTTTKIFPAELQARRDELVKLSKSPADPAAWPEGERILRAHAPKALGEILVATFHPALRHRSIAYLFVENMSEGGQRVKLGVAAKANSKLQLLAKVDFVITFNFTAWCDLSFEARVALVDHEITHCDVDAETGQPVMIPHDIEEFGVIVSRYGLWKNDLVSFGRSMRKALQGDLFNPASDEPWDTGAPTIDPKQVRPLALDR